MVKIKTREEALKELKKLPDNALFRLAELSKKEEAKKYFTNVFLFQAVKSFLKIS